MAVNHFAPVALLLVLLVLALGLGNTAEEGHDRDETEEEELVDVHCYRLSVTQSTPIPSLYIADMSRYWQFD